MEQTIPGTDSATLKLMGPIGWRDVCKQTPVSKLYYTSILASLLELKDSMTCSRVLLILSWLDLMVSISLISEFSGWSLTRSMPFLKIGSFCPLSCHFLIEKREYVYWINAAGIIIANLPETYWHPVYELLADIMKTDELLNSINPNYFLYERWREGTNLCVSNKEFNEFRAI